MSKTYYKQLNIFAAAALEGLLANGSGPTSRWIDDPLKAYNSPVCHMAYSIAERMMEEFNNLQKLNKGSR